MAHTLISRLTGTAAAAGIVTLALLGSAGTASAAQYFSGTVKVGEQRCISQYAGFQVRGEGFASNQGAKFKIQHNGVTVPGTGSPGLVRNYGMELRNWLGNFPGPGYYTLCATNNGTANTNVTMQLLTDYEF
jgi:hypothetical protein